MPEPIYLVIGSFAFLFSSIATVVLVKCREWSGFAVMMGFAMLCLGHSTFFKPTPLEVTVGIAVMVPTLAGMLLLTFPPSEAAGSSGNHPA